jgi:hypothetical protein
MSGPRRAAGSGQLAGDCRRARTERRISERDRCPVRPFGAAIGAYRRACTSRRAPTVHPSSRTVALPQFLVEVMVEHFARDSSPASTALVSVMLEARRSAGRTSVRGCGARRSELSLASVMGPPFRDLRDTNATLVAAGGAALWPSDAAWPGIGGRGHPLPAQMTRQ